ncbi:TIGR02597 family protein [Mucisphaera sp.]|uniref:TIGR02597 family protein n=1 Tax=Mucisphaera sp. TaxID=2913024 RepID=UPI003D138B33
MGLKEKVFPAIAALAIAGSAHAQEAQVGYAAVTVPAGTDTRVSIPFQENSLGEFTIAAINGDTLTVNDPEGLLNTTLGTNAQGRPLYYARFADGPLAGRWFNIVSQSGTQLQLVVEGSDASAATLLQSAGLNQTIAVLPHWTIEAIFPDGAEGLTFAASPNPFQPTFRILVPQETDGVGVNIPALTGIFYLNGDWRTRTGGFANDFVLEPQGTLILRNPAPLSTGEADDPQTLIDESSGNLSFFGVGQSLGFNIVESIAIENVQNDTILGTGVTEPTTLAASGLSQVVDNSPSTLSPGDQVLIFDAPAAESGFDPAAATTVIKVNDSFVTLAGDPANDLVIDPAQVIVVRKNPGVPGEVTWEVNP